MKKIKTEALLETLSMKELKSFDRFLHYSLYEKSSDVIKYWNLIYSKDEGLRKSFGKEYVTRNTLSDFNKQLEKFFIYTNLEQDAFGGTVYLIRELRKRNIEKYFEKLINDLKVFRQYEFGKGYQNTLGLLRLNFEEYMLYNSRVDFTMLIKLSKNRVELSEIIIAYGKLFEYFNEIYYGETGKYKDKGFIRIADVAMYVKEKSSYFKKYYPNIWTLYLIYDSIENFYDYDKIKTAYSFFHKNEKNFTSDFLQIGYDALLRLIFYKLNSGNNQAFVDFYKILLRLEKSGVLKKLNHFPPRIFPGFVIVSINSGNLKLAEKIVKDYSSKIVLSLREQVVTISKAMIDLAKGNHRHVKTLLKEQKPRDSILYLFSKTTLLKSYYENSEYRNIYPLMDTIKHFIRRRSDTKGISKSIALFLNYISKLTYAKKNNGKGLDLIETNFAKEEYFFQKRWVDSMIKRLRNEYI